MYSFPPSVCNGCMKGSTLLFKWSCDWCEDGIHFVHTIKLVLCSRGIPSQVLLIVCVFCISDEREDVQKKTFTKWINSQLSKVILYCKLVFNLSKQKYVDFLACRWICFSVCKHTGILDWHIQLETRVNCLAAYSQQYQGLARLYSWHQFPADHCIASYIVC